MNNLLELQESISNHSQMVNKSKNEYKRLPKSSKKIIGKHINLYFEKVVLNHLKNIVTIAQIQNFIECLLGIVFNNASFKVSFSYSANIEKFLKYILKDKQFKNYIPHAIENIPKYNLYHPNLITFLFLYIFQKKTITQIQLKNFLSLVITKADIHFNVLSKLTYEEEIVLEQIKSGIKYQKLKSLNSINNEGYKKNNKYFSILSVVDRYINIKYISNQEHKHRFHKSPKEHYRKPTIRHYKNGKTILIKGFIVNKGCS